MLKIQQSLKLSPILQKPIFFLNLQRNQKLKFHILTAGFHLWTLFVKKTYDWNIQIFGKFPYVAAVDLPYLFRTRSECLVYQGIFSVVVPLAQCVLGTFSILSIHSHTRSIHSTFAPYVQIREWEGSLVRNELVNCPNVSCSSFFRV